MMRDNSTEAGTKIMKSVVKRLCRSINLLPAVFSIFIAAAGTAAAQEYGLNDLYRLALEQAERIRITEENVVIAETNKNKALSALMPRLSAFGGYTHYTKSKYGDSSVLAPGVTLPGSLIQPNWVQTGGVRLDQSFSLSGREITAFNMARENVTKSKYDLQAFREDYLLNVSAAYYETLKSHKLLDIADANLERLAKYKMAAERRLKVGEVTKTAVLRAQGEYFGAQSDRLKALNVMELSKAILGRLVGLKGDFTLREELTAQKQEASLENFKEQAIQNRADLKSLEIQKNLAEKQTRYTMGGFWPSIAIAGVYTNVDQDPLTGSVNKDSAYGNISVVFPFFEGGLRVAEVKEAKARERQAQLQYDDLKKAILVEVHNTYLDLVTQQGVLKFQEAQVEYAKDNYNAVTRQFEYGLVSSIDVIDANSLLVSAERKLSEARYNYEFFLVRMNKVTGVLLNAPKETKG